MTNPFKSTEAWDQAIDSYLPPGNHIVDIQVAEDGTSSKGNPQIELRVGNPEGILRDWLVITHATVGKIVQLAEAAGVPIPDDDDIADLETLRLKQTWIDKLLGKRIGVVAREEIFNEKPRTKVQGYVTPERIKESEHPDRQRLPIRHVQARREGHPVLMTDVVPAPQARELSKEEHEAWVTQAFNHQQQVKTGLLKARGGLWEAASALYAFTEESGWLALGYDTLGEWLADPDITLTRTTYYRMVDTWRELHVVRELDAPTLGSLDMTKVSIALPALKAGKAQLEDVVSDARELGARDLREKYVALTVTPTGDQTAEEDELTAGPIEEVEPDSVVLEEHDIYVHRELAEELATVLAELVSELELPDEFHDKALEVLKRAYESEGIGRVA